MHIIPGLTRILLFQGLGEIVSRFAWPQLPGPVIGLVLLLAFLVQRGHVNPSTESVANALVGHLGLLFVPAAVGVVLFLPQLRAHGLALAAALAGSVVATIAVTALALRALSRADPPPDSAERRDP